MVSPNALPPQLKFLSKILGNRETQYREPKWLTVSFASNVWTTNFGLNIDFNVWLDDGALLTHPRHRSLLEVFKTWLGLQDHFDATGGQILSDGYIYTRVLTTLHLIDHFLLNANRFQLARYGLLNVTENDLKGLFLELAGSSSITTSIYRWPQRLEAFLRNNWHTIDQAELKRLVGTEPLLTTRIPEEGDRMLGMSNDEIIRARAWLFKLGFYERSAGGWRKTPSTRRLANAIFTNTLAGKAWKPVPNELGLDDSPSSVREYPAAPVTNDSEDRITDHTLTGYVGALNRMRLLEQVMLPIPSAAIIEFNKVYLPAFLEPKKLGRYRNLPKEVVFSSVRNSIEFSLNYGADLVESYLNIARQARQAGQPCRSYCFQTGIRPLLTSKIAALGVRLWTIDDDASHPMSPPLSERHQCFPLLRANVGFWELLRVLYGSIQVCIGTLMARRQGELTDLIAGRCLDTSRTRLLFFNRKSGIGKMREKEARPIPTIAVTLIGLLERLQRGLIEIGQISKCTSLFAFPTHSGSGLVVANGTCLNVSLDYFCDYFETQINAKGERYYVRQHQLRRFFAMLFFWGRAFGGMETLRWFLGHTDLRHLYHYITESIPGAVLRSIKATYAAEQIVAHAVETERLADILELRFGTREFSVLDSEELDQYIEDLLLEGAIQIEPEFFETPEGRSYRILIRVTAKGNGNDNG